MRAECWVNIQHKGKWVHAGAHEAGHAVAARSRGVQLGRPLLVPAGLGFLGSFGAITSFRSQLPNRQLLPYITP
jgi:hypothetical protein